MISRPSGTQVLFRQTTRRWKRRAIFGRASGAGRGDYCGLGVGRIWGPFLMARIFRGGMGQGAADFGRAGSSSALKMTTGEPDKRISGAAEIVQHALS